MRKMKILEDESGVSVVVGILLLTMVVATSVAAFALMISDAQKKATEQKNLRDALESENLKILSLNLNGSNGCWNNMAINVANINTDESRIIGININDNSVINYTDGTKLYNAQSQLRVPPARSKQIYLNLTSSLTPPIGISQSDPIKIILFTSLMNEFERIFMPPVPMIKVNVGSEQIGTEFNDVLILDGSDSIDSDGAIINYRWDVSNDTGVLYSLNGQKARINFNLSDTGRFWVNLTEKDNTGMLGFSNWESSHNYPISSEYIGNECSPGNTTS